MDADDAAAGRTDLVRRVILSSGLEPGSEHPCSYLPDRQARNLAFSATRLPPGIYHSLMDLNYRRSGMVFYRPVCERCRQCRALRVLVGDFRPNRAQRRCRRRNQDLSLEVAAPSPTEEKHDLFRRYLGRRHDDQMDSSWSEFCSFLYASPLRTMEMTWRLGDRLVMVGIVDLEPEAASTVYCYFDPEQGVRSLGVFNILCTIDLCRQERCDLLYLGYYIRDCGKMNYKIAFRPCEILQDDDSWQRFERPPALR